MDTTVFDWSYARAIAPEILAGFWVTIQATVVGTLLALVLGLVWALCRRSRQRMLAWPSTAVVELIRSTPLLVQLYFFFYVLPRLGPSLSPFVTGTLALGLHYSAYMAEVYRAGIDSVPRAQWEAAMALSFTRAQIWHRIILPQAMRPIIPALGNYVIAMFKDTPLLSAITVVEALQTAKLLGARSFRYLEPLTMVGLLLLVVSLFASRIIGIVEARFVHKY